MELTVSERLIALQLLPAEGDFTTIKLVRQAREELSFDEEEHKKLNFRQEGDQVMWSEDGYIKDIKLNDVIVDKIKEALKKLNDDKKLKDEHFSVYEKFVM